MGTIEGFFNTDWKVFAITLFAVLLGFQAIVKLLSWFLFDFLGIETKSMRQKREEHNLVMSTANGLKELTEKEKIDSEQLEKHDANIQKNLDSFMNEIRESIKETREAIEKFTDNRVHDREQSFEIQKQLTDSISKIAQADEKRDEQINKLVDSQKESLADRINQKYKYYLSVNGIPEDEVDEFISLHNAYNKVGGNHHGDAKFNYCMEHLPIIPATVKLKYDEKKE